MRSDALGLFWQDTPVIKPKAVALKKAPVMKALPPPLANTWEGTKYQHVLPAKPREIQVLNKPQATLDLECYPNFFLAKFQRFSDGRYVEFIQDENNVLDVDAIYDVFEKYEVITFMGNNYDIPMIRYALAGASNQELKLASDELIKTKMRGYAFEKKYRINDDLTLDCIDLIELCYGVSSLKIYGGRLNCRKMQDLPYPDNTVLTEEQKAEVRTYCGNDLELTKLIYGHLQPQINLRRAMSSQYRLDLRSKSDAQIAEEVIKAEIRRATGRNPVKPIIQAHDFFYEKPDFIKFNNPTLRKAIQIITDQPFTVSDTGNITMPKELSTLKIPIGSSVYQMGMGGLHSTEKTCYHISDAEYLISDWDVTSYYPQIILNCGLYPPQLGPVFLEIYQEIVDERIAAKISGDKIKADALKIVVNGSFGKLGSPYSALFAPNLMVQVTVTGQLSLLMLIDSLETAGISVVSANTDGIVCKCPVDLEKRMREIVATWEERTGFTMENALYSGLYSRDVNNYIAIKYDGSVKTKGCFSMGSLQKNPATEICNIALIEYLKTGRPFKDTIESCTDITKFITIRTVNKGAVKDGQYLGKAIRWYYAKGETGNIKDRVTDGQIADSEGAKPLMELPDIFPDDIDYDWYIRRANSLF